MMAICSCGPLFYRPKKHFEKNKELGPFDAIIVPGFQYNEGEDWHSVVKIRMVWAKYLYDHGHCKHIIFSGDAVYTPFVEAEIMAQYAEKMGVPREHILIENKAEHSVENIYYSYRLAKDNNWKKVAVATDFVQAKRLSRFIKKYQLPVVMLPIVIDTLKMLPKPEPVIDPQQAKVENFIPLQNRKNFANRFRGTLGKNIKWYREDLKSPKLQKKLKSRIID